MKKKANFTMPATGEKKTVTTFSDDETMALGRAIAQNLQAGDVVALYGEMGSGKTTFVKGIGAGLASEEDVSSPTFTLINEYTGRLPIYHFDFYRINSSSEAFELGCEHYFAGEGVCLLEWSERVLDLLPARRIEIHFQNQFSAGNTTTREITVLCLRDKGEK